MIFVLAGRELRSLFLSPLAWAVLAVVQLILGYMFLTQLDAFLAVQPMLAGREGAPGITDLVVAPLLGNAGIVLLLVIPLLTMRLIAEERRGQTLALLFAAPVSMTEIVLGKYLGILGFLLLIVAMIGLMPLSLLLGGTLDFGTVAAGLLGLVLVVASFAAIGLFMSSLTTYPAVAAITSFGALLLLWLLNLAGDQDGTSALAQLSVLNHFEPLLRGVFDTRDIAYYLLFILAFLVLAIRRMDSYRLQQ